MEGKFQMIYVITKGIYSDYHICAVATSPERAEELRKMYCDFNEDADIEQYEENTLYQPSWYDNPTEYYQVLFSKTGEVLENRTYYDDSDKIIEVIENFGFNNEIMICGIIAANKDHESKIGRASCRERV